MSGKQKKSKTGWISKLLHAVEFNDVNTVKHLIKKGININHAFKVVRTEQGHKRRQQTAIFIAVRKNYKTLMHTLIEAECNLNLSDDRGETPLFVAVSRGKEHFVRTLIRAGADVHHLNNKRETVLFTAVEMGRIDILKFLIDSGCSVDVRNATDKTVLEIALQLHIFSVESRAVHTRRATAHGGLQMVSMIIKASRRVETLNEHLVSTLITLANQHGSVDITKLLIQHGAQPACVYNYYSQPLLILTHLAANFFCPGLLSMWIEAGLNLHKDNWLHRPIPDWLVAHQDFFTELRQISVVPRSLKSLCRINLRVIIERPLWTMVDQLPIPPPLKSYLKMEEYDCITDASCIRQERNP